MKKLRAFLIKHFVSYYTFKIFGTTFRALRCTRIMGPFFLIAASIITFDSAWPIFQWWDWILTSIWVFMCWLTFPWFGAGYFELWPINREELDEEQKKDYDYYTTNT